MPSYTNATVKGLTATSTSFHVKLALPEITNPDPPPPYLQEEGELVLEVSSETLRDLFTAAYTAETPVSGDYTLGPPDSATSATTERA